MAKPLEVEVVYARSDRQALLTLTLEEGASVEQAIQASGILEQFTEIDWLTHKVGVFGQPRQLSDKVKSGDRVEIYRPLKQDPMDARRQRAMGR